MPRTWVSFKGATSMGWNWNKTKNEAVCRIGGVTRATELPKPFGTKTVPSKPLDTGHGAV